MSDNLIEPAPANVTPVTVPGTYIPPIPTPKPAFDTIVTPIPVSPEPVAITPNVVVSNPAVRRVVNIVLGVAATVTTIAVVIDTALPQIDIMEFTKPAGLIILGIAGVFNLAVTVPNIPTK